jgi:long-chain acyl-CoA synthetase
MLSEVFVHYIGNGIRNNWNITALADYKGESFTYGEVAETIIKLHKVFSSMNIRQGDKVSLVGKNSARWCIVYLATVTYGAVIVPILPDFKPEDIQNIVSHSDSVLLFSSDTLFELFDLSKTKGLKGIISINSFKILQVDRGKEMVTTSGVFESPLFPELTPDRFSLPEIPNSGLAVISYTSGTTGHSKGVMLTHNSLAANIRFAQNNMPLKPGDPIVSFLPLAHAYGCAFEFLFPFTIGCSITILTKTPSPQIIMQAFQEIRPALILSVPLVIEKIYKKQILPVISKPVMHLLVHIPGIKQVLFKSINKKLQGVFGGNFSEIVIGGAAFNHDAEKFFRKIGFPFTVGYGMTECGPLISYAPSAISRPGSAGKAVDTLEVRIESDDPENIVGEIIVKGENVMEGYYKNEEATLAMIDDQGWLHTGDLGVIDRNGFIYIKGRSKNLILGPSGQNIYPEELESVIDNKFCVSESLVVHRNDKLIALIFPDRDVMEANHISRDELEDILENHRREINNMFPNYMSISKYEIFDEEFAKTPKRSIKRFLYK